MSIFRCEKCGCVENTATCGYNYREEGSPALCSECDPKIGKWHNLFAKCSAVGCAIGNDGFLYSVEMDKDGIYDWRKKAQGFEIIGIVGEENTDGQKS